VVVVAAGRGLRAGGDVPKQFREVAGVPVLLRALDPFLTHSAVGSIVVVLPPSALARPPAWLGPWPGSRVRLVAGGAERMDSVEAGLDAVDPALAVVLVHDGARPFVEVGTVDRIIGLARGGRSAVAAIPVADTLKLARAGPGSDEIVVDRTVPRDRFWRAQTPQGFPAAVLRGALNEARRAGRIVTDDASAVEAAGGEVVLVPDRTTNLKVTSSDDFLLAEAIARSRS
jgi:2-C-methyl-D-erythritol 4-phosphate cytidylyltransferase